MASTVSANSYFVVVRFSSSVFAVRPSIYVFCDVKFFVPELLFYTFRPTATMLGLQTTGSYTSTDNKYHLFIYFKTS